MPFEYQHDISNISANMKIRCDVGKEWKSTEHYSKNKLHKFSNNLRRGIKTPANSGIACRIHSGEPDTVMQCQGPCGKVYGLDSFSRNTRVRGIYWCHDCTDYQLTNEPGFMPYPAPYAPLVGTDSVRDQANQDDATSHAYDDDTISVAPSCAPTITSFADSNVNGPISAMSTDLGGPTGSSAMQTVEGSLYSDEMTGGNGLAALDQRGLKQFYAWAPDGVKHQVTKAETVISDTTTVATVATRSNGWARPSQRKIPADAPDYFKYGRCAPTANGDDGSDDGYSDDEM